jgi:hypothetical protein
MRSRATIPTQEIDAGLYDLALSAGRDFVDVRDLSDDALRAAWERRRQLLLDDDAPGHRPWAWWVFDRGEPEPMLREQPARLAELGELTADERHALERAGLLSKRRDR